MKVYPFKPQRILSKTNIDIADFVINPYKGCTIGCDYCYACQNKNIQKVKEQWGDFVYAKIDFEKLLINEIKQALPIKRILIGSSTESFQEIENEYKTTFKILSILKQYNIPFTLLTKSASWGNYIEVMNYHQENRVYMTYNSMSIRELFELRSDSYEDRLQCMQRLESANIKVTAYIGPYFPELTDISPLLNDLKGVVKQVFIEAYSLKLGNWEKIQSKLDFGLKDRYNKIYNNEDNYYQYWEMVKNQVLKLNEEFNYSLKIFIPQWNEYYNQNKEKEV